MKENEHVRKYAAEQAISEGEALKKGMEQPSGANRSAAEIAAGKSTIRRIARQAEAKRSQKSREFVEKGAEVYAKA